MPDPSPLSTVPPTVLVVDDEKNIRRTLEMVLSGEGYRVLEAESGEKALETLGNPHEPVDVAIFDLKLPGMSGLDALQRLRADDATRDLPVIVISGHATVHDAVAAIKLGATDFFEKPLNRERVLVSVRNSIRTARLNRTVEHLQLTPTIDSTLWQSLALANTMTAFATNRRYVYQSIGALGVVELTAPTRVAMVAQGLKRLGCEPKVRKYFDLHAILDVKHSEDWNREALRPLVEEEPARAKALAEGALMRLICGARCFDAYRGALWGGERKRA